MPISFITLINQECISLCAFPERNCYEVVQNIRIMKAYSRPTWKDPVFHGRPLMFLIYPVESLMRKYKMLLADILAVNNARVNTLIISINSEV